ncbi:Kynurenine/alpha-aminoadipate aminotransferase-like 3, partial [Homarus americanus]
METISPDTLLLASGMPNPSTFPVLEATFTLKESHRINITPQLMAQALQYSLSSGFPPFVAQLEELTEKIHAPPDVCERQVVVTVGSEHGLSMACGMLINPGDAVLFQEPTYPGLLALLDNVQAHLIPIRSDSQGVIPSLLRVALDQCTDRRAKGRVLRFDSFSKTVAPGLRVGYVTVPKPIGEKLVLDILDNILHASVLPQVILREVLKTWGHEGYLQHMRAVCELYRRQRDIMVEAVDRHLNSSGGERYEDIGDETRTRERGAGGAWGGLPGGWEPAVSIHQTRLFCDQP